MKQQRNPEVLLQTVQVPLSRAEAVKDFFVSKGIRSERITVVTFGEESPVIDKYGDIQVNRRAVTVLD